MLSRKIRSFSALVTSSVGIVMLFLVITQFIPYLVNDSWDVMVRIAGGNDRDVFKFHSTSHYIELIAVVTLGIIADIFQHKVAFLFLTGCLFVASYFWLSFYAHGNMSTLYWTLWLLTGTEIAAPLLARAYIVGQTERRIERARWLVRMVMIEWFIVTLSPFYPEFIAGMNERIFGSRDITVNLGYYLLLIGVFFTLLFYFGFQTIPQLYGISDLSHQVEELEDPRGNNNNNTTSTGSEEIWKGKKPNKKATVTAVVEYMLDIKEEEERKALRKYQEEEALTQQHQQLQRQEQGMIGKASSPLSKLPHHSTLYTSGTSPTINWRAVSYLLYVLGLCLTLHLTFQISFNLFEKIIAIVLCENFQVSQTMFHWIYFFSNALGLVQYYFLERFTIYRNVSYSLMMIGIFAFLCMIWIMIHGESIFVFVYLQSSSSSNIAGGEEGGGVGTLNRLQLHNTATGTVLYNYIHLVLLIVGSMLSYAFAYPLSMMSNLIAYSCIPIPSFTLCLGGNYSSARPLPARYSSSLEWLQYHARQTMGYNTVQSLFSLASVLGIMMAEWILQFEKISIASVDQLTTIGEFITKDPTQSRHRNAVLFPKQNGLSMQEEMEILYYILFFASVHFLILCISNEEFEWIFATTRQQRESLLSRRWLQREKRLSTRQWLGIGMSVLSILYVIMMKRIPD